MRTLSIRPARLVRALVAVSFLAAAGCGGGSSGSLPNPNSTGICDPDAQSITVARPSSGFPANGNSIEIVSSSGSDQLHGSPGSFDLIVTDNFNNQFVTSTLSPVPDTGGPHPYTNDFYYQGNLNGNNLLPGRTYNVYLNAPSTSCTPGFVGQIFT
ncbi:MAG TPA: hypothetical protein VHS78_20400 [Candidatus Elarobacter sp.]|nr:hypothetical protein [Candidatus Elarobacter sp.]